MSKNLSSLLQWNALRRVAVAGLLAAALLAAAFLAVR